MVLIEVITMHEELNNTSDKNKLEQMLDSIKDINIDYVIFYITSTSKILIKNIETYYNKNLKDYFKCKIITICSHSDIIECIVKLHDAIMPVICNAKDYQLIFNYTFGTNEMTMAQTICAIIYHGNITINKDRYDFKTTIINKKTSNEINELYEQSLLKLIKRQFNDSKFNLASSLLDLIPEYKFYDEYKKLFTTYEQVDRFIKIDTPEKINKVIYENDIYPQLLKNSKAAKILKDRENPKYKYYIVGFIIVNAKRRSQEKKYDDAIARLYRALELIKTIKLKEHGISLEKTTAQQLRSFNIDNLNNSNKYNLTMGYRMLSKLNDEVGIYYMDNYYLYNDLIISRNDSILAHGYKSKTAGEFYLFYEAVLEISKVFCPQIETIMSQLETPQFKIN